jgi:hypothetical protein
VGKSGKVKCGTGKSGARRKIRQQGKVENRKQGKVGKQGNKECGA